MAVWCSEALSSVEVDTAAVVIADAEAVREPDPLATAELLQRREEVVLTRGSQWK